MGLQDVVETRGLGVAMGLCGLCGATGCSCEHRMGSSDGGAGDLCGAIGWCEM